MAKTLARAMTFWFLLCAQTMAGMAQQSQCLSAQPRAAPEDRLGRLD